MIDGMQVRSGTLSVALCGLTAAMVVAATAIAVVSGMSWAAAVNWFVVSNSVIGAAFGGCGFLIARYRPGNPVGWLMLAMGVAQACSALAVPLAEYGTDRAHWPLGVIRALVTVFLAAWPWSIAS
jgi:hypothetical protein